MREILFRGKAHDGRWVVSRTLWNAKGNIFLRDDTGKWIHVVSETVGQYTGINAADGTKIFEGDIVSSICVGVVVYEGDRFGFRYPNADRLWHLGSSTESSFTVEGNIHDNPELVWGEAVWEIGR